MSHEAAGQLTIDDLHHLEPQTNPETDPGPEDPIADARKQALEGGPRYGPEDTPTPGGRPDSDAHPPLVEPPDHCQNCGSSVLPQTRRVFGDNNDIVWKCQHCPDTNQEGLANTANTANQDRDVRDRRARRKL